MSSAYQHSTRWGERHVPTGLRSVLGVLLLLGGTLGFLPVLGFWMIPLGVGLLALDFPPLRRRLERWLDERSRATKQTQSSTRQKKQDHT
ncbi:MAG: hypothetical protein AB7G75_07885 [Candidatus Binatia bacterium]